MKIHQVLLATIGPALIAAAFALLFSSTADASIYEDVAAANADPGPSVVFLPPGKILLDRGPLVISTDVTIVGAGTTLDAQFKSRAIEVTDTGTLFLQHVTVARGRTNDIGSCVLVSGTLKTDGVTFRKCKFSKKLVFGRGGAIYNTGVATISKSSFYDAFGSEGGAIYNSGQLLVEACTFFNNRVTGTGKGTQHPEQRLGGGAGIANYGTARVSASYFEQNRARLGKGGGALLNQGDLVVVNSTFFHNRARKTAGGFLRNFGTARLAFVTAGPDQARWYSGNISNAGVVYATHVVVYDDRTAGRGSFNCAGPLPIADGVNLATTTDCGFSLVTQPILMQPANYGGPTLTRRPRSDKSPVVNAGPGVCEFESAPGVWEPVDVDQRGQPRTDGACDLGAVELQPGE